MEEERRKRKLSEEENEEQKMEKFFALIKRTKDQLFNKEKNDQEKKGEGIWNPKFQPEDFIHCGDQLGIMKSTSSNVSAPHDPHAAGPSHTEKEKEHLQEAATLLEASPAKNNEEKEHEKASDHHLDLNLSL
ncbi:hypothetical protein RJT34_19190 [Clitoria ternatea]|uniref:Uncharacterized protein n=1 Tax=Clitoria ternatea TaxID=43366 RepID=A0AAN9IQS2_CLITE